MCHVHVKIISDMTTSESARMLVAHARLVCTPVALRRRNLLVSSNSKCSMGL